MHVYRATRAHTHAQTARRAEIGIERETEAYISGECVKIPRTEGRQKRTESETKTKNKAEDGDSLHCGMCVCTALTVVTEYV